MKSVLMFITFDSCVFCPCFSVTRRCFPALGLKDGKVTVGNNTQFDDGSGTMKDAKDLVDGVKYVVRSSILP